MTDRERDTLAEFYEYRRESEETIRKLRLRVQRRERELRETRSSRDRHRERSTYWRKRALATEGRLSHALYDLAKRAPRAIRTRLEVPA